MPVSNYLKVTIGEQDIVVSSREDLPININYLLEDQNDSDSKRSSEAISIEIPANIDNDITSNTFRNPDVEDLTVGKVFDSWQQASIESNGQPLLNGKAFLKQATHTNIPISYTYDILGDNADWLTLLTDKTLYDFIKNLVFTFDKPTIIASWDYDGTNEALPYVFAPVRYRYPFGDYTTVNGIDTPDDNNVLPDYMRPAISKYWILYWAFKSIGYQIRSEFMDTEYFRRQVMPWTFGNFLDSDGTQLEAHKFLAKSSEDQYFEVDRGKKIDGYINLEVTNDSTDGAFDNNNDYTWDSINYEMKWTYNAPDFGLLGAAFSMTVWHDYALSGSQSNLTVFIDWFINGTRYLHQQVINDESGIIGTRRGQGQDDFFFKTQDYGIQVALGDVVSAKISMHLYRDKNGLNDVAHCALNVLAFELNYFRIMMGGTIDYTNYTAFQKYKVLDYFKGIVNEFDLSFNTDVINKIVYIEPTHPYTVGTDPLVLQNGYFKKDDFIKWDGKEDLSKKWILQKYSDIEKEQIFNYKEDNDDGILKKIQDRNINILSQAKYVLPSRFIIGNKTRPNKFFSATMHYFASQWKDLGTGSNVGITPQVVCLIPENVSNTSQQESSNTFNPKSCYYKGNVTGAGAWRFDGDVLQNYPFMFSVNYQSGGHLDPVLSYCDENISGVIAKGLVKRFFWQRLAIMRRGQRYTTSFFHLNNKDVANQLHREYKVYKGQKYELIQIKNYKPLSDESTQCIMYKWEPISQEEQDNTYPSVDSLNSADVLHELDIKYARLLCLQSDIPT